MFRRYSMLFKKTRSRYISWNILFLWGLGLWLALCTSNMYYSAVLNRKATLFYLQNSNLEIAYNASTKTEAIEDMLQIATASCSLHKIISTLKAVLRCICVFVSSSFVILFISSREYLKWPPKTWNDAIRNTRSAIVPLTSLVKTYKKDIFSAITNKGDHTVLRSTSLAKFKIDGESLKSKSKRDDEEDECVSKEKDSTNISNTGRNVMQTEIIFNSNTYLLFVSSCELYRYFINWQLENTLSRKFLIDRNLKYIASELKLSSDYANENMKKSIVSSSTEFQRCLENLQRSRFFYPYMLKVSTSYIIRIKSI